MINAIGDVGGGLGASGDGKPSSSFDEFWSAVNETVSFGAAVKLAATVGVNVSGINGLPSVEDVKNLFTNSIFVRIDELSGFAALRGGVSLSSETVFR